MWLSFWRTRNRFSLDELRYLTDQLMKVQVVNEVNKDFVIEALRSIAELITYGDQHDSTFFEFFMEKQVMGEFVRLLKISTTVTVSLQLLQTVSIMIQNLKSEHAIYYLFSNEYINYLITYKFDFENEELLSYYISFLRAISGKLNKNTISLFVKTEHDEVVAFPLYVEAVKHAFDDESMIRTAIRALTLNVYHVGDESVNNYISSNPHTGYFLKLVEFFRDQCIMLNGLVLSLSKEESSKTISEISSTVDEIEDNLYYFSDVISAGIPDVGTLITDSILKYLVFPLLLPSLRRKTVDVMKIGPVTSLYLLCCILRIVKIKDLANTVAAAFLCSEDAFLSHEVKVNGHMINYEDVQENQDLNDASISTKVLDGGLRVSIPNPSSSLEFRSKEDVQRFCLNGSNLALREALLSYISAGNDAEVMGSLSMLATLLQTKELDESMLDALGILPQRKQHKKLLLKALMGEGSGEEQLFSSENGSARVEVSTELHTYMKYLKDQYGLSCSCSEVGVSPRVHRYQVLDSLVSLFCRSNISADALWDGGWLLRQLLPYSEAEFKSHHLRSLKESYRNCSSSLLAEARGAWLDQLITVLCDEWRKCKRAIEASSPRKDPKFLLFSSQKSIYQERSPGESSFAAADRLCESVKAFVLLHQLQTFTTGGALPDQPNIVPSIDVPETSRARTAGVDDTGPKSGAEIKLVDAVPCRISFERGKERHFQFLAMSVGTSGWIVLAEESPLKEHSGIIRVAAPLAGCCPRIDEKHPRWLHLRIRPSAFPISETSRSISAPGKGKSNLVDGRWTLAFRDEDCCKSALSMIIEERDLQSNEVERRLQPLLESGMAVDLSTLTISRTKLSESF